MRVDTVVLGQRLTEIIRKRHQVHYAIHNQLPCGFASLPQFRVPPPLLASYEGSIRDRLKLSQLAIWR
jgi:hypothetical protein